MSLAALIFDVDGTLAETEEVHRKAFNDSFVAAGLPWHWGAPLYSELLAVTGGKERIAAFIAQHDAAPALGSGDIARLHADKNARYAAAIASGTAALRPGVARLLHEAKTAGLELAIATTTSPSNLEALLRATLGEESLSWFKVIAAGDCVAAKKPAPDVYQLVLEQLQLAAPSCIAFEDTVNGLRSAHGAGIRTVVTPSLYGGAGDFAEALAVVDHLGEPDQPCRLLRGPALVGPMVDVAQVRHWSSEHAGP